MSGTAEAAVVGQGRPGRPKGGYLRLGLALTLLGLGAVALLGYRRLAAASLVSIAYESEPISLDPLAVQESATHATLSNIYEGLTTVDADMRMAPALALNWESSDERTWVVRLRPGVRFHDGGPLRAVDVERCLLRARDHAESGVRGHLAGVEHVEVVDDLALRLRTREPDALLMNRLSYVLITRVGADGSWLGPVGTGPYRLVRHERGQALELEAFRDYWGPKPGIAQVRVVSLPDAGSALQALEDGRIDLMRWVPETLVAEARRRAGLRVHVRSGLATYFIWMDTSAAAPDAPRNPLADVRVRQALSGAIDRQELVRRLGGLGTPAYQCVQQGLFGHVPGLAPLPADPGRARALLREAGYGAGLDLTMALRHQPPLDIVAEALRQMLAAAGVRLKLETLEWPQLNEAWRAGRLPVFLAGWGFESGDAASFFHDCLRTRDAGRHAGGYNAGYSNEELDRLVGELQHSFTAAERAARYARLGELTRAEMPLVPLYHRQNAFATQARLRWSPRLDGQLLAAEMSFEER